ncbi:MAG: helix-turn-helix domain-containing protein [Chloroflexi bacterium]|nr:helix-turn-helix domain-containing protein [Chloroflexota bacterium]
MRPATTLLTVAQVAALLNVHPNTVRRWAELGVLRALRIGPRGDRRFYRSEVERLLEAGPKAGPLED